MTIDNQHQQLDEIDARQDEVLQQLDELNRQVEDMILQIAGERRPDDQDPKLATNEGDVIHNEDPARREDSDRKAA